VQVHNTWSIIGDFNHNDDFFILEFSEFLRGQDLVGPVVVSGREFDQRGHGFSRGENGFLGESGRMRR